MTPEWQNRFESIRVLMDCEARERAEMSEKEYVFSLQEVYMEVRRWVLKKLAEKHKKA